MKVLGIFIGTIFGWIFLEMVWPSLFAILALGWVGYGTISENLVAGFSDVMVARMFVCLLAVGIFTDSKAAHFIAQWIISRKVCIGRPHIVIGAVLLVAVVIGLFDTNIAGIFICWSFIYSLAEALGIDRKTGWVQFLACIVCPICIMGGMSFPFYSGPLIYNTIFEKAMNMEVPFVGFTVTNIAILVVMAIAFYLVVIFGFRPDFGEFETGKDVFGQYRHNKMNRDQKIGFAFLLIFIALLALPHFLPQDWAFCVLLNKFEGIVGVAICLAVVATNIRKEDGSSFYELAKGTKEHVPWPVMWTIIATIPLANAFQADECGILPTVMGFLQPLLGNMNPVFYAFFCMILLALVTQVVHNLVLAIVFVPIFCNMMVTLGGNPVVCYIMIYWGLSLSFLTPAASMSAVLMHGNEDVTSKGAYGSGAIILVVGIIVTAVVGYPLCSVLVPY